jgi:hypothetical protein
LANFDGVFQSTHFEGVSGVFRQYRSKHPFILGQNFDQPVEDPFEISENRGLRPQKFDPSMSLRALKLFQTSSTLPVQQRPMFPLVVEGSASRCTPADVVRRESSAMMPVQVPLVA